MAIHRDAILKMVRRAVKDNPVTALYGPRQCGKTTLVRDLVAGNREFITMDDDTVLAAARSDPTGLVRALDRTTIDEVQRVPDLLRAIKKSVDDDRRAGRFLLTGSAITCQEVMMVLTFKRYVCCTRNPRPNYHPDPLDFAGFRPLTRCVL